MKASRGSVIQVSVSPSVMASVSPSVTASVLSLTKPSSASAVVSALASADISSADATKRVLCGIFVTHMSVAKSHASFLFIVIPPVSHTNCASCTRLIYFDMIKHNIFFICMKYMQYTLNFLCTKLLFLCT